MLITTTGATTRSDQSGAAVGEAAVSSTAEDIRELERAAPERCPDNRRGLRYYRSRASVWATARGAASPSQGSRAPRNCADAHYLAQVWRSRSFEQRQATERWEHLYAWWLWLPANWQALGACETGGGQRPGNWAHSNSSFTSAFGISWAEYDADAAYMGAPPWHVRHAPRDQYDAARGHLARFGDGWDCPGP
jgi:hypothetical protein